MRLLVLPESALGGYLREPGPDASAPDIPAGLDPDGPEIARLIELAGDVVVCAGYTEAGDGVLYASAVCVNGDGVLGRQRKVHLPPAERFAYTAGDGFAAFDTPVGRVGMLLCYDKLFPEAARALALDGADVICSLSAWAADRMHPAADIRDDIQTRHFDLCDQTRAVENQVFVVSANQTGPWGPLRFLGSAKVVDPGGARARRHRRRRGPRGRRGRPRRRSARSGSASTISPTAGRTPTRRRCPRRPCSASRAERPGRHTQRMCGIVAEHGGSDPEALERMLERLAHRGPDDRGTVQVNGSWLGHRRLSIVDVGGGQQPLSTRDESAYLVGNGEVYNHEEVRAGLVDRELLTTSDNEVALHLIDERGVEGLGELSGMFAFVMAGRDGRFVAARDPVGIKPLYWAQRDGAVRFASEMHAFDPEWQSFVEPFPPGCAWTPEGGMVRFASAVPAASLTRAGDRPRGAADRARARCSCARSSSR